MEKEKEVGASAVAAEKGKAAAVVAEKGKGAAAESEAAEGPIVPLKSSDGLIFDVPAEVARQFKAIADKGCADADDGAIPLPNVDGRVLCRVIEYGLKHHRMNDHPDDDDARSLDWDDEFVSTLDVVGLEAVMQAAQYLGYERLLRRCRKAVRDMMVGKTGEEILATFGLENEFTPEEAEIAAKYAANVEDD